MHIEDFAQANGTMGDVPFPIERFPAAIRDYCEAVAESVGVDVCFPATACLPLLAACVGNARVVAIKRTWTEPCVMWSGLVAPPSGKKSPTLGPIVASLRARQSVWFAEHAEAKKQYETALQIHGAELSNWKKSAAKQVCIRDPPAAPERPICRRIIVNNATVESLSPILTDNPRGIVSVHDELTGWLGSHNRYTGASGADEAFWLSCFRAEPATIDRKTTGAVHVPRAAASLVGGIQPSVLARIIAEKPEMLDSGMLSRFLLCWPAPPAKGWTDAEIPIEAETGYEQTIDALLTLEMVEGDYGPEPGRVPLSSAARHTFAAYVDRQHTMIQSWPDWKQGIAGKIEAYAARLALLFHLLDVWDGEPITEQTVLDGIAVAEWYLAENCRVIEHCLPVGGGPREPQELLLGWLRRRKEPATVRDVQRAFSHVFKTADEARAALEKLQDDGHGTLEPGRVKGSLRFRLT